MSESATMTAEAPAETVATTTTPPPADPPTPAPTTDTGAALLAEVDRWKAMARKHEQRAKDNADAAKQLDAARAELDQFRQSTMSEQEKTLAKAVKEAAEQARAETLGTVGQRLVRAEFRAAAAGAIPDLDSVLDDLNLGKFVGQDGEPDSKAIAAAVKRLAPPPPPTAEPATTAATPAPRPDLTQGTRQNMPLNGDPILDRVKAKLGIA